MKRIITIFAALFAAVSFVSCQKEETLSANDADQIIVNINVDGLTGGLSTKAVKNSWANGDKINIWFDDSPDYAGYDHSNTDTYYPELILTYNDGSWGPEFSSHFKKERLKASGRMKVLYENSNDIKGTFPTLTSWTGSTAVYYRFRPIWYRSSSYYNTPMMVRATPNYTFDSETGELTSDITGWSYITKIQVVVTGFDASIVKNNQYTLSCDNLIAYKGFHIEGLQYGQINGYDPTATSPESTTNGTTANAGDAAANADGVAFYFYDTKKPGVEADYKFTFGKLTSLPNSYSNQTITVTGKTLTTYDDKLVSIKLDLSTR